MITKNSIYSFTAAFLLIGFLFLSLPQEGEAGGVVPFPEGCCQFEGQMLSCLNYVGAGEEDCIDAGGTPLQSEECNEDTGLCSGFEPVIQRNVPTLSEWGLVAMAAVLGIVGFFIVRRKQAAT